MRSTLFTRTIILLAFVSFFTDIASEMLYPIIPLYLSDIGYGIVFIGLLEGLAQVLTGSLKFLVGIYSDALGDRVRYIRVGYFLSALAKPLLGLWTSSVGIYSLRLVDRIGKGIRTTPRDALLTEHSTPETRGRVFGFHRAIDTLGAVIGPIITLILLYAYQMGIPTIILATVIPGLIAVGLTLFLREKKSDTAHKKTISWGALRVNVRTFLQDMPIAYRKIALICLIVTLIKSSDIYLLLRARELGLSDAMVVMAYIAYNISLTLSVLGLGFLSDRWGYLQIYVTGIMGLGLTYAILSSTSISVGVIFGAFILYGVFVSVFEGLSVAWISLTLRGENMATGLGVVMIGQSLMTLIGTLIIGYSWTVFGGQVVFLVVAILAAIAGVVISRISGIDRHDEIRASYPCIR